MFQPWACAAATTLVQWALKKHRRAHKRHPQVRLIAKANRVTGDLLQRFQKGSLSILKQGIGACWEINHSLLCWWIYKSILKSRVKAFLRFPYVIYNYCALNTCLSHLCWFSLSVDVNIKPLSSVAQQITSNMSGIQTSWTQKDLHEITQPTETGLSQTIEAIRPMLLKEIFDNLAPVISAGDITKEIQPKSEWGRMNPVHCLPLSRGQGFTESYIQK